MPRLTDPIMLAGRGAPSRVLFGPHTTNLARRRAISDRHVAYYERRAAGGAGVVVTETASVHDADWPYERAPLAADCGPGWQQVAAACHRHGALALAGLGHAGSQGSSAYSQQAMWAPSRVPDVATRELPLEMEQPEIDALITGFAAAAAAVAESGMDGVEIGAGQHSLLRQFLSGLTNQRRDGYGTDRPRLLRQVLGAVRANLGDDRVLGLRLSCDELAPWAGITPEHAAAVVAALAATLDYLVVVRGSAMGTSATRPDAHTAAGFNLALCHQMREAAAGRAPVVLQGSIVDPGHAQRALDDGVADLVEMTRAQLADPDLVGKLRSGHSGRVRPCVLANQKCRVRDNRNPIVSCLAEPRTGHELVDPDVERPTCPDGSAHAVLVVGGGPAGMEAARVLALRGHAVELAERTGRLGGTLPLIARLPGHDRFARLDRWWQAELERLAVTVSLGAAVTKAALCEARAAGRRALLATGSVPGPRGYHIDGGTVVEAGDLLASGVDALPGGQIVVYDPVGDATGVGVAELLASAGRDVAIVTQDQVIGTQLALTGDLADANARLQRAGVELVKRSLLREVHCGHVLLEDAVTGERRERACAAVVHCGYRLPDGVLSVPGLPRAGDCVAPRTVHEAVLEGRRAALRLAAAPAAEAVTA